MLSLNVWALKYKPFFCFGRVFEKSAVAAGQHDKKRRILNIVFKIGESPKPIGYFVKLLPVKIWDVFQANPIQDLFNPKQ